VKISPSGLLVYYKQPIDQEKHLKKKLVSFIRLTHIANNIYLIVFITLFGIATAEGTLDLMLPLVLSANVLLLSVNFILQDIATAPGDTWSESKSNDNPISEGLITQREAITTAILLSALAVLLLTFLGWKFGNFWVPAIFGAISLFLGFIQASCRIRLTTMPVLRLVLNCLLINGLIFSISYFSYSPRINANFLIALIFILCISAYGEMQTRSHQTKEGNDNKLHKPTGESSKKSVNTGTFILLSISILTGVFLFFFNSITQLWVMILFVCMITILILPSFLKQRKAIDTHEIKMPWRKPLERAAAIAFLMQFIMPSLMKFLK